MSFSGPSSLEDLVPLTADRTTAVIPVEPTSTASMDEELDSASRTSSSHRFAGWRAFLDAHPRGACARELREGRKVARRLGASATTPGADPADKGQGYGYYLSGSRSAIVLRAFCDGEEPSDCFSPTRLRRPAIRRSPFKLRG